MRKYFYEKLKNLHTLTGLNQFKNMQADGENTVNDWLDEMVRARKQFSHIYDEEVERIIDKKILSAEKLIGFYPRQVSMWLGEFWSGLDASSRHNRINTKEEEESKEIATGEKLDEYLNRWKKSVQNVGIEIQKEREEKPKREAVKIKQKIIDCPECDNNEELRPTCGTCQGFGKIKKTIL